MKRTTTLMMAPVIVGVAIATRCWAALVTRLSVFGSGVLAFSQLC